MNENKKIFLQIMNDNSDIAIATSIDNIPNIRYVSFYYSEKENKVYFMTFKNSPKTVDFSKISTVPKNDYNYVKATGILKKSEKTPEDLKDAFCSKLPDAKMMIEQGKGFIEVYEISFSTAVISLNRMKTEIINL
jgi:hypothetical protein